MKNLLFPIFAILFSLVAYYMPNLFTGLKAYIVPLLMVIMLGMGLTLKLRDFYDVYKKKKAFLIGVLIQFIIMPLAAFFISKAMGFSNEITVGMMLVGTAAGGTASNVMTYIAKGDVALSVSMTFFSTLLSIVLMPLLTWLYIGEKIDVPALSMLYELIKIIVAPIAFGILINRYLHKFTEQILPVLPIISIVAIILIVAIVVALNNANIQTAGLSIFIGVILHNSLGLFSGYYLSKLFKFDEKTARTVAIEVGMQNSGLSVALAIKYFTSLSALPGAIFSIWHNISGSLLASYWHSKNTKENL